MPSTNRANFAYTTLITRTSYLAGVIILAHTLRKHGSQHPLVVFYTDKLAPSSIRALELETHNTNLILRKTEALLPNSDKPIKLIAERFADTWTKLRVFSLLEYDQVCYLDADMTIRNRNMDSVFDAADLPIPAPDSDDDWLAANHTCCCNLDKDAWAPEDWTAENCPYTPTKHPGALSHPTPVTPDARPTYKNLNGGLFLFRPRERLWRRMLHVFNTSDQLTSFKFPDQDFLAMFFDDRWKSVGWQWNALKTMRYWHPDMWRDEEVVCLHYIVDKPWAKRVGEDGVAGYKGRDGETHMWWWEDYEEWRAQREAKGEKELLGIVKRHVAQPPGEDWDEDDDMKAIGSGVQNFAKSGSKDEGDAADGSAYAHGKESNGATGAGLSNDIARSEEDKMPTGSIWKLKPALERGHGPVVHTKQ